jgi:hypothetical protein
LTRKTGRKYIYRVYRPVKGAWRSGKKADLLEKIKEPQGLLEDVVRQEGRQLGRRRNAA